VQLSEFNVFHENDPPAFFRWDSIIRHGIVHARSHELYNQHLI
jgi:hypothetical protein